MLGAPGKRASWGTRAAGRRGLLREQLAPWPRRGTQPRATAGRHSAAPAARWRAYSSAIRAGSRGDPRGRARRLLDGEPVTTDDATQAVRAAVDEQPAPEALSAVRGPRADRVALRRPRVPGTPASGRRARRASEPRWLLGVTAAAFHGGGTAWCRAHRALPGVRVERDRRHAPSATRHRSPRIVRRARFHGGSVERPLAATAPPRARDELRRLELVRGRCSARTADARLSSPVRQRHREGLIREEAEAEIEAARARSARPRTTQRPRVCRPTRERASARDARCAAAVSCGTERSARCFGAAGVRETSRSAGVRA